MLTSTFSVAVGGRSKPGPSLESPHFLLGLGFFLFLDRPFPRDALYMLTALSI